MGPEPGPDQEGAVSSQDNAGINETKVDVKVDVKAGSSDKKKGTTPVKKGVGGSKRTNKAPATNKRRPKEEEKEQGALERIEAKWKKVVRAVTPRTGNDGVDFALGFAVNFIFLLMIILPLMVGVRTYVSSHDYALLPLQVVETRVVYELQSAAGVPVEIGPDDTPWKLDLKYDDLDDRVITMSPECAGFQEMVFISVLVLGFGGIALRKRIKWAFLLSGVIFIENIVRVLMIHFLAIRWGWDYAWDDFHSYFWREGQLIFVMILFILWFMFVANKEIARKAPKKKGSKGKKGKKGGEKREEGKKEELSPKSEDVDGKKDGEGVNTKNNGDEEVNEGDRGDKAEGEAAEPSGKEEEAPNQSGPPAEKASPEPEPND